MEKQTLWKKIQEKLTRISVNLAYMKVLFYTTQ